MSASLIRMRISSTTPPTYPDISPIRVPITSAMTTSSGARISTGRAPQMRRTERRDRDRRCRGEIRCSGRAKGGPPDRSAHRGRSAGESGGNPQRDDRKPDQPRRTPQVRWNDAAPARRDPRQRIGRHRRSNGHVMNPPCVRRVHPGIEDIRGELRDDRHHHKSRTPASSSSTSLVFAAVSISCPRPG